ncbi:adenylate/guanylate cyclase domain-containing protein [Arenibacter sp. M-2]|uniref:adenylate/guanylate cyclase domain-containing protein n=1 Tax=Arenibacter sp. M-2 TaxID=3053612 RepID=UPI0025708846|nr:adenylate/guanylate cyclase domain-containing protein [Arenibacter sp. M-2]MDL5512259.1 adenylate/guanylate cyclase domain-containing protein [Arenibacter sp. M-2]
MNKQHKSHRPSLINMHKIMAIAVCWILVQFLLYVNEYSNVSNLIELKKLSGTYKFWPGFYNSLHIHTLSGIVGGIILVTDMPYKNKQRLLKYGVLGYGLLFVISYLILFSLIFIILNTYNLFLWDIDKAFFQTLNTLSHKIMAPSFFVSIILWGILVSVTQFMFNINEILGKGILWRFILGHFNSPKEEERIFMFLDLKGATTIAEKMESKLFFEMLKEVYYDISTPILESDGEIYQYVGDEVIITWPIEKGLKNNNCLMSFFRIEKKIQEKKLKYLKKYGVVPSFKAGIHLGKATVGEIGVIKKEIVYSGDVLNTTSRVQDLCNYFDVKILISNTLLQLLQIRGKYINIPIGEISLRGKENKIALSTIAQL